MQPKKHKIGRWMGIYIGLGLLLAVILTGIQSVNINAHRHSIEAMALGDAVFNRTIITAEERQAATIERLERVREGTTKFIIRGFVQWFALMAILGGTMRIVWRFTAGRPEGVPGVYR